MFDISTMELIRMGMRCVVFVLCMSMARAATNCSLYDPQSQRTDLTNLFSSTNGTGWVNKSGWNTSSEHCMWYGVECNEKAVVGLMLDANRLQGAPQIGAALACSLVQLSLRLNRLTGTIPASWSNLQNLQDLSLANNNFTGPLPDIFTQLPKLQYLDLSSNLLNGSIGTNLFCSPGAPSSLIEIKTANNKYLRSDPSGNMNLRDCHNLFFVDFSNCNLSLNSLPVLDANNQMYSVSFSLNLHLDKIGPTLKCATLGNPCQESKWLDPISNYTRAHSISLTINGLGSASLGIFSTIPPSISRLQSLNTFELVDRPGGVLPPSLFEIPSLTRLVVAANWITGTLPSFEKAHGLYHVDLSYSILTGTLPPSSVNVLSKPGAFFDTRLNFLCCCGEGFFHDPDYSNYGYSYYNDSKPRLPRGLKFSSTLRPVTSSSSQASGIYPSSSTYWNLGNATYAGLLCPYLILEGQRDTASNLLDFYLDPEYYLFEGCVCVPGLTLAWKVWNGLRIMQCVDAPDSSHPWDSRPWIWVLVSLGVVALLALIGWLFFRFYGQPHIVQKLIGLRKKIKGPPVFGKATVVVTDIQGFSEMMHREPMLMVSALVKHNRIIAQVKSQNFGYTIEQEGDSFSILFEEAVDALRFCVQAQAALDAEPWPQALFVKPSLVRDEDGPGRATTGSEVKSPSSFLAKLRSLTQLPSIKSNFTKPSQALSLSLAEESALPSPGASSGRALSSQVAISMAPAPSCPYMSSSKQGQGEAVKGLRVRMGVASGIISKGAQGIAGSALLSDAKTVSDAAAGGQILVDYTTFHLIKDRLVDLVSPHGIQMEPSGPAVLCCKGMDTKGSAAEALLLDMGTYLFHGTSRHPAALTMMLMGHDIQPTVAVDRSEDRSIAPVQRSLPQSTTQATGVSPLPNVIRLFQILSPFMIHRLQYFPSKPTLKEGWDCIDAPSTEAVGALMALAPGSNRPLLPSVTMVFSQVESSSNYLARHRLDASKVHLEIAAIMKSILRQIPGGYCVREQEAELKYLTAFSTPESALLFCISFQECLHLYALSGRLPKSATSFWGKEEDCFCGPRVKMGVFEGRPSSISPDHNGKADYHGHCINMAARLMDAAAHGGMVACPADLAERVFRSWSSRYDEDPDAAGAEPIPAWEPKRDSLVDGRLLEVSTKPIGVFQMKGSEELLSLVNVSPLALAGRQLPSSAPKGKGNRVSMNDGPLLRSALPLLKLTDEYARLPKLPSEVASQSTVSPPHLSTMGMLRATYSRIRSLGRDYASTAGISSGFTRQPSRRSEITEREDSCHYHDSRQSHGQSEGRHAGGQDKTHYSLSDANRTMSC